MAEKFLQNKLYEYKANSNLVLESERDFRTKRGDEGTGEVESLKSKVHGLKMGDRVHDFNSVNDAPSKKRKLEESIAAPTSKRDKLGNLEKVLYIPKSAECRQAYEEMLTILRKSIGDISHDMLKGAATEVLEVLKDANKSATVQRAELKIMSGDLDEEQFRWLLSLSKRITDYNVHMESVLSDAPLEEGMAVVFDDEDDENVDELIDDDENDVENTISGPDNGLMKKLKSSQMGDDVEDQMDELSAHDIDAYWLQRQLSKYYIDPNVSAKLADEVLATLHSTDERICENNLVMLLDFDKFSLIKYFLKHRHKIYYCIKLKQAQSEEDRQSIEAEMKNDMKDGGFQIWSELNERNLAESWAKDRMGLMADRARREAHEIAKLGKYEEVENPLQNQGISGGNIDLDSLVFKDGGHFMANTRCELPEKSWRAQKKGYEEVHVPAFKPVVNPDEKLVQVSSLPDWMHSVFEGVRTLNRVQSKMCTAALDGDHNLLLCAPTGSGKTNVALLCMLGIIAQYRNNLGDINFPDFKIVYIAPMKALVQECVQNFAKRLSSLNISVRELSGDQSLTSRELADTNVIVTTPEKWDVVTRKSMDRSFTQLVKLIIIDEIHLLHDDRGAVLEGLVARTLRQCEIDGSAVRLVGLSATLPNYEDVATFLRVNSNGLFFFDSSYRPVPLQQQFIGITEKKVLKKVQTMNEICYEKVLLHAGKNQVLIFTHSRADTVKTAKALRDLATTNDTLAKFVKEDSASSEILRAESANAKSAELKDLLPYGFAVHHAGLQRSDRSLIEDLFADRHIQVLISTATLAWGVNLPCHTVIIKGTQIYSPEKGAWTELSPLDVLQMIGRAGRYGLDSEGEGIIITNHSELQYYLSLLNNQLPIESQLVKRLPDLLNAEIVSQSIGTLEEAAEWLGYTYMYIRMLKNPQLYGIDSALFSSDVTLFKWRKRLAMSALTRLEKNDLIKFDRKSGVITSTYLGRISSHYYITNETIAAFKTNMRPTMSEIDILRLFALSSEFKFLYVKEEEKMELGKLLGRVPIPIKESFEEAVAKINVLLQAFISRMRLEGYAINSDMIFIQQSAGRLMRAMFEIALSMRWSLVASKVLYLCAMIERRMWWSQNALRQFHAVPEQIVRKLERIADISWEKYLDLKPQDLGEIVKNPKMGKILYKFVHMVPKLSIVVDAVPISRAWLRLEIQLCSDFDFNQEIHGSTVLFWVFIEDADGERILHHEPVQFKGHQVNLRCSVKLLDPVPPQYFVKVVADRWLHSVTEVPISFKHLILPEKFLPCTELLDLRSIPIAGLSAGQQLFFSNFKTLNAIQTQLFFHLNDSKDNLLILAPSRAGKTACAELSLLQFLITSSNDDRCLVLCPHKVKALKLFQKWSSLVKQIFGMETCILTGDSVVDMSLSKQSKVIIAQPSQWDALSKKWRTRKVVQQIGLYILFDLHTISSARGSCYEIVISRSRFIESQLGKSVRFLGLGYPIANSVDVADWIGVARSMIFNFSRHATDGAAEVQLVLSDHYDPINRVSGISKSLYRLMKGLGSPSIVFVPSRKVGQILAIDFLFLSKKHADQHENIFDQTLWEGQISDAAKELLKHGIGIIHGGLTEIEIDCFQQNLARGTLWVLIIPIEYGENGKFQSDNVFIADTVVYDGKEDTFIDISPDQLLQISSVATKKCIICCHSTKKDVVERAFFEPLPVESYIGATLHSHLVGEIVNRTVESKAEAVDYLTWTFYYRRLSKNPNYYNLSGASIRHISDHLSELVESVVGDLEQSKFIAVENDMDLSPLNLAMIASHYNLHYLTVELFASTLTNKSRIKGIIDIVTHAQEFNDIPVRLAEDHLISNLMNSFQLVSGHSDSSIQQQKVLVLVYAHFNRSILNHELTCDLKMILEHAIKFVHSIVDVLSSQGWLKATLAAMELSQMIVQGMWDKDDSLLQIPHFSRDIIEKLHGLDPAVETVFDLLDLDDTVRTGILKFPTEILSDVAKFCNSYPAIEVSFEMTGNGKFDSGSEQTIVVQVDRDITGFDDMECVGRVVSQRFPSEKFENWWVVLGESSSNVLLSIKRFTLIDHAKVKLEFIAPDVKGAHSLSLFIMCDSYLGVDQEYNVDVEIL